jgi:uncharacterized delta-60 repeat protein
MNPLRFSAYLLTAFALAACSSSDSDPPANEPPPPADEPDDEPPADEPSFELSLSVDKLPVLQGTSETLEVTVERKNGFEGAIELTQAGLPDGVKFDPVTIEEGEDKVTIELFADDEAPHSLPTSVAITGKSGKLSVSKELTVTVYGPPGSLDTSFEGGIVTVPVGESDDYAYAMAVQPDGKIVLAGRSYENLGDFAVVRLERDGKLDKSFGDGGKVIVDFGEGADVARAVAIQKDGKIVVAGSTDGGATKLDFGLIRLNRNGSLDEGFGDGGKVVTSFSDDADTAYAMLIQEDGKIVVGGDAQGGTSETGLDFALARYNEDGSLDEDFGEGGKVMTPIADGAGRDSIYALSFQEVDGELRIVAVGGEGDFSVARYNEDGSLDIDFGEGGKVSGIYGSSIGAAHAVAVDEKNRVVVAGHSMNDFALVRLTADGELDEKFGDEGRVSTALNEGNWDRAQGLAIEPNGKLVVAGWVYEGNGSAGNFALLRYDASGELDPGFGDEGVVITEVVGPMKRDEATAVLLQTDERVPTVRALVAGWANVSAADFAVARYWL